MRATFAVLLVVALLLPATDRARAQPPDDAAGRIAQVRTLAGRDTPKAISVMEGLAADPDVVPDDRVRAARVAIDVLPFADGNRLAARLLLDVLRRNRSQPDAWQLAFRLRDRVMDGLDLADGEPFLRAMVGLYPEQVRFRYYLAELLLDGGRPEAADAECMEILRQVPDDTRARYTQALLRELEGNARAAVALYDEVIALDNDLSAHVYKVRVLWDVLGDYTAAEDALRTGYAAVDAAPAGRARDRVRADLENEERLLHEELDMRSRLATATTRLDRILAAAFGAWALLLGGGVVLLRRRGVL